MALDRGTQTVSDHPHQQCEVFERATAETVWLTPAKSPVPYVSPPSAWHAVPMASLKPGDLFRLIRLEPPFDVIRTLFARSSTCSKVSIRPTRMYCGSQRWAGK